MTPSRSIRAEFPALAEEVHWNDLLPAYISTIDYTFRWLAGYQALPRARESLTILLGDHQPAGSVTGPGASWDVPVHIVTANPRIAERLRQQGFVDGMQPPRQALGHISELTTLLLAVFDSGESSGPGRAVEPRRQGGTVMAGKGDAIGWHGAILS